MLLEDDLQHFLKLCDDGRTTALDEVVCDNENEAAVLYGADLNRLFRSLQIAVVMGRASSHHPQILRKICENNTLGSGYPGFHNAEFWRSAIETAVTDLSSSLSTDSKEIRNRQDEVGDACNRLIDRGYSVDVGADGPCVTDTSRKKIGLRVDSLVRDIGGSTILINIFEGLKKGNLFHQGKWMLGNTVSSYQHSSKPQLPLGWLVKLALGNLKQKQSIQDTGRKWVELVDLSTDYAASLDCQRYNGFEQMTLEATAFLDVMVESVIWRDVFVLQQAPRQLLSVYERALEEVQWPAGSESLQLDCIRLVREGAGLCRSLAEDGVSVFDFERIKSRYPLLQLWSTEVDEGHREQASEFLPKSKSISRENKLFHVAFDNKTLVLPVWFAVPAICETLFRSIWAKANHSNVGGLVGDINEKVVEIALRHKKSTVFHGVKYRLDGMSLEVDSISVEPNDVSFFEVKSKPLTQEAQKGSGLKLMSDFEKSYLTSLKQLIRHDRSFRSGELSSLVSSSSCNVRTNKIAISPLSFGPIADKMLVRSIIEAIMKVQVEPIDTTESKSKKITNEFNSSIRYLGEQLTLIAPKFDGKYDFQDYLHDMFWLDVGELVYLMDKSSSVSEALSALRSITFSSRNFWTEVAYLERQLMWPAR